MNLDETIRRAQRTVSGRIGTARSASIGPVRWKAMTRGLNTLTSKRQVGDGKPDLGGLLRKAAIGRRS